MYRTQSKQCLLHKRRFNRRQILHMLTIEGFSAARGSSCGGRSLVGQMAMLQIVLDQLMLLMKYLLVLLMRLCDHICRFLCSHLANSSSSERNRAAYRRMRVDFAMRATVGRLFAVGFRRRLS